MHRSDGSGTTFQFATYLSRVSADWKNNVGADTAIDWPTGIGAKGNEGVAGNVAQISGSIGYVEYAYAKQNHLAYTKMINKAGQTVEPTVEAFKAGAASADWVGAAKNDFYVLFLDSARRAVLADHRHHLRAGLQEPAGPGRDAGRAEVLPVGL